ncbi:hypothetical protein QQX98_010703 [Neonectria punicea]|uniref:Uncharacterized protein n=1 Tax=Neonectria punicea TaxID=979145 RepID=A0ABR1GNN9_9HYPO
MVINADGKVAATDPVPSLRSAARYGPTIFPIAFAAVVANFLRAMAAWKLERGITVLNLELLLSSRTVFSAFSIPFSIRTVNALMPLLMVLWVLSPLGGQAALRVVEIAPSGQTEPWPVQYLEFMSPFPHTGPIGPSGPEMLPAAFGAFSAALASPPEVKADSQDAFGNIKIPMIEAYKDAETHRDQDGWFDLDGRKNITYSSLSGLPFVSRLSTTDRANYSFVLETSYLYANCSVSHRTDMLYSEFFAYMQTRFYNNYKTLIIEPPGWTPQVIFTSFTYNGLTNATCNLTTSFVETDVRCRGSNCENMRIRPGQTPKNIAYPNTVLSGTQALWYFSSFINASNTPWKNYWTTDPYSTPIEYYFTHPDSPSEYAKGSPRYGILLPIPIRSQRMIVLLSLVAADGAVAGTTMDGLPSHESWF